MTQKRSSKSLTPNISPFSLVSIFITSFPKHLPIPPKCISIQCFTMNHCLARQISGLHIIRRKRWRQFRRKISGQECDSLLNIGESEVRLEHYFREGRAERRVCKGEKCCRLRVTQHGVCWLRARGNVSPKTWELWGCAAGWT